MLIVGPGGKGCTLSEDHASQSSLRFRAIPFETSHRATVCPELHKALEQVQDPRGVVDMFSFLSWRRQRQTVNTIEKSTLPQIDKIQKSNFCLVRAY